MLLNNIGSIKKNCIFIWNSINRNSIEIWLNSRVTHVIGSLPQAGSLSSPSLSSSWMVVSSLDSALRRGSLLLLPAVRAILAVSVGSDLLWIIIYLQALFECIVCWEVIGSRLWTLRSADRQFISKEICQISRRAAGIQFPAFYQNLFSSRVYFDMSSLINPCDSRCLRMQDVSSFGHGDCAMSNGNITLITWTLFISVSERMSLVSGLTLWTNQSWSSQHSEPLTALLTDLHLTSGCFHCRGSDSCGDFPSITPGLCWGAWATVIHRLDTSDLMPIIFWLLLSQSRKTDD